MLLATSSTSPSSLATPAQNFVGRTDFETFKLDTHCTGSVFRRRRVLGGRGTFTVSLEPSSLSFVKRSAILFHLATGVPTKRHRLTPSVSYLGPFSLNKIFLQDVCHLISELDMLGECSLVRRARSKHVVAHFLYESYWGFLSAECVGNWLV